eukprot:CAMPEP_0171122714 /NCGR_PEP_ID=MMETSP0766_2-20121228/105612_1 /TAXON_ID=439317 /ORGANISM="Gambierdiscus australes, Strain CAWD 149" /LENGTH=191 /DNA_ID=CAMNT_0011585565 /DNA_START=75 /DNA_END=647 /DNA_ORIENTATION=-
MTEADTVKAGGGRVTYFEGRFTSYRSPYLKAAFPFGHGLSYTNFSYSHGTTFTVACPSRVCVRVRVTNSGAQAGREVAQVYFEFPVSAQMPSRVLKGFKKTRLLPPGEFEDVSFSFTTRDLSSYSGGIWTPWNNVTARIGASSTDLRIKVLLLSDEALAVAEYHRMVSPVFVKASATVAPAVLSKSKGYAK